MMWVVHEDNGTLGFHTLMMRKCLTNYFGLLVEFRHYKYLGLSTACRSCVNDG